MPSPIIQKSLSNIDISHTILSHLSVSDTDNYLDYLKCNLDVGASDIEYLKKTRKSPIGLLSKIVDDPERLLKLMADNRVLLSGSRAVSFMYPTFSSENSDWDFYCSTTSAKNLAPKRTITRRGREIKTQSSTFWSNVMEPKTVEDYLTSQGAIWCKSTDVVRRDTFEYDHNAGIEVLSCIIKRRNKVHKIQFIYCLDEDDSAFSKIVDFHSTVVQCFITGFSAVSMYDVITNKGFMLPWLEYSDMYEEYQDELQKCKTRRCEPHIIAHSYPFSGALMSQLPRLREEYRKQLNKYRELYPKAEAVKKLKTELVLPAIDRVVNSVDTLRHFPGRRERFYRAISGVCRCEGLSPTELAIEKYKQRGFKVISPSEYLDIIHSSTEFIWHLEPRSLSDGISYTYMFDTFDEYTSEDYNSLKEISRLYSKSLHSSWYEYGGYKDGSLQLGLSNVSRGLGRFVRLKFSIPSNAITLGGI